MRFSDHFGLRASQAELDFVDIPLHTDIPLFIDPYALSIEPDPWFAECNNLVVSFFQLVIDSIRANNTRTASELLLRLREPNDTHFGLSSGAPRGRGIGVEKTRQLYDRLTTSEAVRTRKLMWTPLSRQKSLLF